MFQEFKRVKLSVEMVESYLQELSELGYKVEADVRARTKKYALYLPNDDLLLISYGEGVDKWLTELETELEEIESKFEFLKKNHIRKFEDFHHDLELVAELYEFDLGIAPIATRFKQDEPFTNRKILMSYARVSEGKFICDIQDPYFKDASLITLDNALKLGMGMAAKVRILIGKNVKPKDLSKSNVQHFELQHNVKFEIKVAADTNMHARNLFRNDGQVVVLGHSLNALDKDESIHIKDGKENKQDFEDLWLNATSFPF